MIRPWWTLYNWISMSFLPSPPSSLVGGKNFSKCTWTTHTSPSTLDHRINSAAEWHLRSAMMRLQLPAWLPCIISLARFPHCWRHHLTPAPAFRTSHSPPLMLFCNVFTVNPTPFPLRRFCCSLQRQTRPLYLQCLWASKFLLNEWFKYF